MVTDANIRQYRENVSSVLIAAPQAERFAVSLCRELIKTAGLFLLLWLAFYSIYRGLPYVTSGASLIYRSKIQHENSKDLFASAPTSKRVLIFGNSKVLAGFIPAEFDNLAKGENLNIVSFNSGFPGIGEFVPQLKSIVSRGQVPNVILLTIPWGVSPPPKNIFNFAADDKVIAEYLFPFRNFPRDALSFYFTSRDHGGVRKFYMESEHNVQRMLRDRGYYFISEQSHFKGDRLPADFHVPSDTPGLIQWRSVDTESPELSVLNSILRRNHISCFFVPSYSRIGEAAPAPIQDTDFLNKVESNSPCRVLGSDYLLFPNSFFSDQTHLNRVGAGAYTKAIYALVSANLHKAQ